MRYLINMVIFLTFFYPMYNSPFTKKQKDTIKKIVKTKDPHVNIGIYVTSASNPDIIFAKHINRLFTPASNTKLFTAAAAFHILGPDFHYKTTLSSDGSQKGNRLLGNLYLKASGDPSLTQHHLIKLFSQLKTNGITFVNGDICIDLSIFDNNQTQYFGKGSCIGDIGATWHQPTTSLIVDKNNVVSSYGITTPILDPQQHTLLLTKYLLAKNNINYNGTIRISSTTNKTMKTLAQHSSKPMKDLIAHMLKTSDNLYANAIFKTIGAHQSGTPGTWENGKQAVKHFLSKNVHIDPTTLVLEDGAGCSQYNLISPQQTVKLLTWIYNQPQLYDIFLKCLAVSGTDGTLKTRMTKNAGIIKAKTGTLGRASSLCGYLLVENHTPFIFSIYINNFIQSQTNNISYKRDIEDKICEYLTECIKELKS